MGLTIVTRSSLLQTPHLEPVCREGW